MLQLLLFTITGILVYVIADGAVRFIERRRGRVLENRSVYFFVVFLVLILVAFELLQRFAISSG